MGVITYLEDDPGRSLHDIFQKILHQQPLQENYYQVNNIFNCLDARDKDFSQNVVAKLLIQKLEIIQDTITDHEMINLATYLQIWEKYCDFTTELTDFIGNRQPHIINILPCTYAQMFLDHILLYTVSEKSIICYLIESITIFIKTSIESEQEYFIENLIHFLASLDTVSSHCKQNTHFDAHKIICELIILPQIMERMCEYMHIQLFEIQNDKAILDNPKYYMMQPYVIKNKNITTATTIIYLLCTHVINVNDTYMVRFIPTYTNYLQLRITTPKYDLLDLEMIFAEKICADKNNKMYSAVLDIKKSISIKYSDAIQVISRLPTETSIKNDAAWLSGEPVSFSSRRRDNTKFKINPLILKKDNWVVDDVSFTINYPLKIKYHLDKISEHYPTQVINWQPTLDVCAFNTLLGNKIVSITCNFLQAIALSYFDEQAEKIFMVQNFATYTKINMSLSLKIFESLFESYIIIDDIPDKYVINDKYNGPSQIDIRPIFIKVFEDQKN